MKYYYRLHGFNGPIREDLKLSKYGSYILSFDNDVRRFEERGVKEVTKEQYEKIVEDEKRILEKRSDRMKEMIELYLPESFRTGWHRPFCIESYPKTFDSRNKVE